MYFPGANNQTLNLQAVLVAAASGYEPFTGTHHPISCMTGKLEFDEENILRCEHGESHKDCGKVQSALDASVAILLFEELHRL